MTELDPLRFTRRYPQLGTTPADLLPLHDPARYAMEIDRIYRRAWLNIGRTAQVARPGDFFVFHIPTFDLSVLVVHSRDGVIRAFHNVCAHRQFPVAMEPAGHCSSVFMCRMHGWSYDTSGKLIRATQEHCFFDLDKSELGLKPIHCGVWNGFICINLDPGAPVAIDRYYQTLEPYFSDYPFASMAPIYSYSSRDAANWKTALHAQNDFWHVPYLHRATISRNVMSAGSSAMEPVELRPLGLHRGGGLPGPDKPMSLPPTAELAARYGPPSIFSEVEKSHRTGGMKKYAAGREFGDVCSFTLFPNWQISFFETSYMLFRYWPVSVSETIWEFHGFGVGRQPRNAGEIFSKQYADCLQRDTYREDAGAHPLVQRGVASGAYQTAPFHDQEIQLRHLNCQVEALLERSLPDVMEEFESWSGQGT